jgi:hypothetical protein
MEGNLIKDNLTGEGKEFNEKGKPQFDGIFHKGKKWSGIIYDSEGHATIIIDENRKGCEYYNNGNIQFEGEFLYGKKWNGKGYDYDGKEIYEIINGKGNVKEYSYFGRLIYEGEYLNGERKGKGKTYWNNRLEFEGEFNGGNINGKKERYKNKIYSSNNYNRVSVFNINDDYILYLSSCG